MMSAVTVGVWIWAVTLAGQASTGPGSAEHRLETGATQEHRLETDATQEHRLETGATQDPFAGNACVQCHRQLAGRSSEIVDLEWKTSVHYANGVACDGCHGGDATLRADQFPNEEAFKDAAHLSRNPEFLTVSAERGRFISQTGGRSVSYFCGRCHALIKEKHLGSPHGDFGDPSCLYCHGQGSHAIQPASLDIIDTRPLSENGRCALCHQASTMEAVATIRGTLQEAATAIEESGSLYADLEKWGYHNLELESLHHHRQEVHSGLRRVFHSFNMREINDFVGEIKVIAERTAQTHRLIDQLRRARHAQTLVGLLAAAFLVGFALLLVFYKHRFCSPHGTMMP